MSSHDKSASAHDRVEDLVPVSHFLLENRAVERRESKTLKEQLQQAVAAQKKSIGEMNLIYESMKSTEERMGSHVQKMIDANAHLRKQRDQISSIKEVDVRFDEKGPSDERKIPVAVVKFSKRAILKGTMEYGRSEVETSEEVIAEFDPQEEVPVDCLCSDSSDDEASTSLCSQCSSCDLERLDIFFSKGKCGRCGRTRRSNEPDSDYVHTESTIEHSTTRSSSSAYSS
uniref:Uncharacterized protein n=1 Tax=Steinernema glaseri TaxID=37863 RepID=A0A1I7YZ18_9BILA